MHRAFVFKPIRLRDYVRLHLKSNPVYKEADLTLRLRETLEEYKAGVRCSCGTPIWVIGSVEVGHMCFKCITGSTDSSEDYEIDEACDKAMS
jgi:hypothetical protein